MFPDSAGLGSADNPVLVNSGAHTREPSQVGTHANHGASPASALTCGMHRQIEVAVLVDPRQCGGGIYTTLYVTHVKCLPPKSLCYADTVLRLAHAVYSVFQYLTLRVTGSESP